MHCTGGGNCAQGRRECVTPEACGASLGGGTYWPRDNAEPVFAVRNDHDEFAEGSEPMSDMAKACWAVALAAAAFVVAAGLVDWLMSF